MSMDIELDRKLASVPMGKRPSVQVVYTFCEAEIPGLYGAQYASVAVGFVTTTPVPERSNCTVAGRLAHT